MRYAGLQFPNRQLPAYTNPEGHSIPGHATGIRMRITHPGLEHTEIFTVGINCRRPDRYGSIFPVTPVFERAVGRDARRLAHVCPTRYDVSTRMTPGGAFADHGGNLGRMARGDRRARPGRHVDSHGPAPDGRQQGWLRTSLLCP